MKFNNKNYLRIYIYIYKDLTSLSNSSSSSGRVFYRLRSFSTFLNIGNGGIDKFSCVRSISLPSSINRFVICGTASINIPG